MIHAREIEERINGLTLPGLPPGKAIIPDYDGYSICAIPSLVRFLFGEPVEGAKALADALDVPLQAPVKKVVLLIIDGIGFYHFLDLLKRFPDLVFHRLIERGACIPLTSIFPSTTATALTTLSTGLTPQEHGMVGYRLYLKEISAITNMIRLSFLGNAKGDSALDAGIDVRTFIGASTLYERLHRLGVESHVALSRHIASSGLSNLLYNGSARLHPVVSFSEMLVVARQILHRAAGKVFVSLYWGATDAIAHVHGPWTEEFAAEFRAVDAAISRELEGKAEETLVIVCSDHGFVQMVKSDYRLVADVPELARSLLLPPVGEPRASYLFVRGGKKESVIKIVEDHFGDDLACLEAARALEAGLFGRGRMKAEVPDRIGDLLVVSTGRMAIHHPYKDAVMLQGMHGGLTAHEMLVPLIVCCP